MFNNLSIVYWILNRLRSYSFAKLSSLSAYTSVHDYDCISETFLDSSFDLIDSNLQLKRYDVFHADHHDDVKRGRVCIYYKEYLPIMILAVNILQECIMCNI